jgi:predicted DNA-binding protein YlxM (UPF0122 family)
MDKQIDISIRRQTEGNNCSVCRDLLIHLNRFFEMLDSFRKIPADEWLTVEEIAQELKLSKSIVYRLIRNGELEAVNLVETDGYIAQKGHYRIKRQCLDRYLEQKKVKPLHVKSQQPHRPRHLPKVKNHLGL